MLRRLSSSQSSRTVLLCSYQHKSTIMTPATTSSLVSSNRSWMMYYTRVKPSVQRQRNFFNAEMPRFKENANLQAFFVLCLLLLLWTRYLIVSDDVNYPGAGAC